MIMKQYNYFLLVCDNCCYEEDIHFRTFRDALDYKSDKANGWRAHMTLENKWEDNCPMCVDAMYGQRKNVEIMKSEDLKCHNQNVHKFTDIQL